MNAPAKVLIVDDEPHVRRYLSKVIRLAFGRTPICEAGDAETALALCIGEQPPLVLLDLNLVGGSGLQLLPKLQRACPGATIVIVTAERSERLVEQAAELGAAGYILKGTSPAQFAAMLRAMAGVPVSPDAPSPAR